MRLDGVTGVNFWMPWVVYVGKHGHPPIPVFVTPSHALAVQLVAYFQVLAYRERHFGLGSTSCG